MHNIEKDIIMKLTQASLSGFGSYHSSESLPNALPQGQNSPQQAPYHLFAEQLNGSAFTSPRHHNLRSWLYRLRPSVLHSDFQPYEQTTIKTAPQHDIKTPPTQMRWDPLPYPTKRTDFVDGLMTILLNGHAEHGTGAAVHLYAINESMHDRFFYNADGELLIVPEQGGLTLKTEFGDLIIKPKQIAVIPRGIKFQVLLMEDTARGYVCENYGAPFRLPELGPIGANGLANPRDFVYPHAAFEDVEKTFHIIAKFQGHLWQADMPHSPLDVVAWHGNYAPYSYDLTLFNTIGSVSFDHPDPSIFTVLTSQSELPGVANVDFVIFPERWMVSEHTFRPPYYHRNIMSEYMGLITGSYDAKEQGFVPGGGSLHNCMSAHGPDFDAYQKATTATLAPEHYKNTLAFMFESKFVWQTTKLALDATFRQKDYLKCWQNIKKDFKNI